MASKRISGRVKPEGGKQLSLAASTGPAGSLTFDQTLLKERPQVSNWSSVLERCRELGRTSSFLTAYIPLKKAFYNFGFRVAGVGGDEVALEKWLDTEIQTDVEYTDAATRSTVRVEMNLTNREAIRRLMSDVWDEYLLLDNCVVFWMDDGTLPTTLPLEKCKFQDKLGLPLLWYRHGLSEQEIELLPDQQKTRFKNNNELLLDAEQGEHFKVLKRSVIGTGFAVPSLYSMFRTFAEIDAKEAGYHSRAWLMRGATRHHKLGHEIRQGPHSGKGTWFWNVVRDRKVREIFTNRQGPHEFTSNFDHTIEYPWPDVSTFDETAWKGTNMRLRNWGGPVAQMLLSDTVIEGGLAFLRSSATQDREDVAAVMNRVIKASFRPPSSLDIRVCWSDLVFNNPAQAAELLKFAVQQGMQSVTTARQQIGLDNSVEDSAKVREADDPDAVKKYRPAWDTSHGFAPQDGDTTVVEPKESAAGPDPGANNGRPIGSSEGSAV